MPKKNVEKDLTPVTLVTTDILTPYAPNEVFTVPKYVADQLLDENREDEDGNAIPVKVRIFDAKADAALLAAQRGKTEDVEVKAVEEVGLVDESPKA
jgi:hypothetical protein